MTSVEHIRTRVYELITKHEPYQSDSVDVLMKKWKGKENDFLKTLCERYKEKYYKLPPIQIKTVYSIGSKLETGGFAVVRKCKRRNDGVVFALKVISKKHLDEDDLVILESEVNIMRQISHPNIVKLYDIFDSRSKMCLILELLEGGELFDRIIEKGHFSEKDASASFTQMCSALAYLHERSIVHREIKPENFLFATKANDSAIKLIDFGLAGSCKNGDLKTPCGTPNYVAPEILRRSKYDTQVDMWSIGVVLYIMLCGFPPFYDENDDLGRLYKKIKRAEYDMPSEYWDNISKDAKDLVRKLLQVDPKKRLTAKQSLQHPWLKKQSLHAQHPDNSLGDEQLFHLKRFQYIRRLRVAVRAIVAVLRLSEALQGTETLSTSGGVVMDESTDLSKPPVQITQITPITPTDTDTEKNSLEKSENIIETAAETEIKTNENENENKNKNRRKYSISHITEKEQQIHKLQIEIANMKTKVTEYKNEINSIQNKYNELENKYSECMGQLKTMERSKIALISAFNGEMDRMRATVRNKIK